MTFIANRDGRARRARWGRLACSTGVCLALALMLAPVASAGQPCPAGGEALVADPQAFAGGGGGVIGVARTTGVRRTISSNNSPPGAPLFNEPYNLALEKDSLGESDCDTIVVADTGAPGGSDGQVIRVDPATGQRTLVSATGNPAGGPDLRDPVGIGVESSGDILVVDYTGPLGTGAVIRVDPTSGARTLLSDNANPVGGPSWFDPWDLGLESSGDILVTDPDAFTAFSSGQVVRVDPSTGGRTNLSEINAPVGTPDFVDPQGLSVSGGQIHVADENAYPAGAPTFTGPADLAKRQFTIPTTILVTDPANFGGTGGVISVNASTGVRTLLSENANPAGAPNFEEPWGIIVVPNIIIRSVVLTPVRFFPLARARAGDVTGAGRGGGATLRYTLTRAARVVFTVHRRRLGRNTGFRCRRETPRNRTRPRCRRWERVGSFARQGRRGRNRVSFSGIIRNRALQPGSYRMTLVANDRRGERTDPVSVEFRVRGR
jgi:hypothetical protein